MALTLMMNELLNPFHAHALWPSHSRDSSFLTDVALPMNARMIRKQEAYFIHAILPGLSKSDVKLTVTEDRHVRISADSTVKTDNAYRQTQQSFSQEFYIPVDGDIDAAEAKMEHGVLEIRLPRVKPAKPPTRTIAIA